MLDIYTASAGSGKTFTLTLEYFRLIFRYPTEYRSILAVTFTNKATEEMKSRIMNELHKLAEGQKSAYSEILQRELKYDAVKLQTSAKELRTAILHDYSHLSITTIDSFFQRVIKSFTRELGIYPSYNVELDSDFVLSSAVDKVVANINNDKELKRWLLELLQVNIEEGRAWSIKSKIQNMGSELFSENYMLFSEEIISKFGDKAFLRTYKDKLVQYTKSVDTNLSQVAKEAVALIENSGLGVSDFKRGKSGAASWFYKLIENVVEPSATVRSSAENKSDWMLKTSERNADIEAILPLLMDYQQSLLKYYDIEYPSYLAAKMLQNNLYQLGIFHDIYNEIRKYCDENMVLLLSDTIKVLNSLIEENDSSFIFEKCGNYYKHIMIDEFQDISQMQWQNFRPLIVNSLSERSKVMIVGDVKQSIYRWRGGDWNLLANTVENDVKPYDTHKIQLENNWRSTNDIVEFNNYFFTEAVQILASSLGAEQIFQVYENNKQNAKNQNVGYVSIKFGEEKNNDNATEDILQELVDIIYDIVARGGSKKDVVILVRDKKEGALVADYLINHNKNAISPINFISNDSLFVSSSSYVQFIEAILLYLVDDADEVNKAYIHYYYSIFVKKQTSQSIDTILRSLKDSNPFDLLKIKDKKRMESAESYSLFESVEFLVDSFSLKENKDELTYLIAFQEIIYEYQINNSNSIPLFLEWWDKEKSKRVLSTSEENDAVRILTIHKSKGLEYEYVLLPFCTWEFDSVKPMRRIWCSTQGSNFDELPYVPLDYSAKLDKTIFTTDYQSEHLKAIVDNLNLLYVALTRPKLELYLRPYAPKRNKTGEIKLNNIAELIYTVIGDMKMANRDDNDMPCLELGKLQIVYSNTTISNDEIYLSNYPVYQLGDRISVKYRHKDLITEQLASVKAIDQGKLLHEIFKTIKYPQDIPQAVRYAYINGLITDEEIEDYILRIENYLRNPDVSQWFCSNVTVINEKNILLPNREGSKMIRPDRVMIIDGVVHIVDYKFGQKEEKRHIKQIANYCNVLQSMGYEKVQAYLWYVEKNKIVTL